MYSDVAEPAEPPKTFFVVRDDGDANSKCYKVFLRASDMPRLRVAKIRKTMSQVAQAPPDSFDLYMDDDTMLQDEHAQGQSFGLRPECTLIMKPRRAMMTRREDDIVAAYPVADCWSPQAVAPLSFRPANVPDPAASLAHATCTAPASISYNYASSPQPAGLMDFKHRAPSPTVLAEYRRAPPSTIPVAAAALPTNVHTHAVGEENAPHSGGIVQTASRSRSKQGSTGSTTSSYLTPSQVALQQRLYDEAMALDLLRQSGEYKPDAAIATLPGSAPPPSAAASETFFSIRDILGDNNEMDDAAVDEEEIQIGHTTEVHSRASSHLAAAPSRGSTSASSAHGNPSQMFSSPPSSHQGPTLISSWRETSHPSNTTALLMSPTVTVLTTSTPVPSSSAHLPAEAHVVDPKPAVASDTNHNEQQMYDPITLQLAESLRDDVDNLLARIITHRSEKNILSNEVNHLHEKLHITEKHLSVERQKCESLLHRAAVPSHMSHAEFASMVESESRLRLAQRDNERLRKQLREETHAQRVLHNILEDLRGNVRVVVRLRPQISQPPPSSSQPHLIAAASPPTSTIRVDGSTNTVHVYGVGLPTGPRAYEVYKACSDDVTQADVFHEVAPLVRSALDGMNTCLMAYGQTGSGKTYTVLGAVDRPKQRFDRFEPTEGIIPRFLALLFQSLEKISQAHEGEHSSHHAGSPVFQFSMQCSFIELYNDQIRDLLVDSGGEAKLDPDIAFRAPSCDVRITNGVSYVVGVTKHPIASLGDALGLVQFGCAHRRVESTRLNAASSRSHGIMTVYLSTSLHSEGHGKAPRSTNCKMTFVDLAGSERVSKSLSTGDRLKEAQYINKSLSALGDVVALLSSSKAPTGASAISGSSSSGGGAPPVVPQYVPYRNNKLTMLLQDSLGGTSKAILIACIAPTNEFENNTQETLSTLAFAARIKCVRNYSERGRLAMEKMTAANADENNNSTSDPDDESVGRKRRNNAPEEHEGAASQLMALQPPTRHHADPLTPHVRSSSASVRAGRSRMKF